MANTYTYTGSGSFSVTATATAAGDVSGSATGTYSKTFSLAATASLPTTAKCDGFLKGTLTAAAGDILVAHATDPLQSMGNAVYSDPNFSPASKKVIVFAMTNLDATNTITVTGGASNGLPLFAASGDAVVLRPNGGTFIYYDPNGTQMGALTTGSNDKVTIAVGGGSPTADIFIAYQA